MDKIEPFKEHLYDFDASDTENLLHYLRKNVAYIRVLPDTLSPKTRSSYPAQRRMDYITSSFGFSMVIPNSIVHGMEERGGNHLQFEKFINRGSFRRGLPNKVAQNDLFFSVALNTNGGIEHACVSEQDPAFQSFNNLYNEIIDYQIKANPYGLCNETRNHIAQMMDMKAIPDKTLMTQPNLPIWKRMLIYCLLCNEK